MKGIILIVCFVSVAGVSALATDFYPPDQALSLIQKTLKEKQLEITGTYDMSEMLEEGHRMVAYSFKMTGGEQENYAVFTESKGRYDLFDYLVITDKAGTVQKVQVIKYRSEHGGEIASRKWLSQFENYKGGELHYGDDISAVSGATLSAGSITRDMQKVVNGLKTKVINR